MMMFPIGIWKGKLHLHTWCVVDRDYLQCAECGKLWKRNWEINLNGSEK